MKNQIKTFFSKYPATSIKAKTLAKRIKATNPNDYAQLKEILHALAEEGFLERKGKRYRLAPKTKGRLTGTLQILDRGAFGFVVIKDSELKDVFVPERHLDTAFHGDTVEVALLATRKGKNIEGQIVKIINRARTEIIGTLNKTDSFYFVEPDDQRIHRDIYIPEKHLKNAKDGDKVVVSGVEWKNRLLNPEGRIAEILGRAGSFDTEILSIAREFNLNYEFPEIVLNEAKNMDHQISVEEIGRRLDLRDKTVFTIDPLDAKDFDDAVSIEDNKDGSYLLGVHIADVGHYLKENSEIFKEAEKRSTSVYLVGKVIPMLPEKLSNNICSLVPGEDRLTYSALIQISASGQVIDFSIKKTIIRSKRRFTYEEVQEIIDTGKGDLSSEIILMNQLAKNLRKKRVAEGSINFHTPEVEFELDAGGIPLNITVKKIKESNNLIEEFMLLANRLIAEFIAKKENKTPIPFVYRIHDLPDREKLLEFSSFVKSLGFNFNPEKAGSSMELQRLLESVDGSEEEALINEIAIRSMAKAVYDVENIGHYGLGFDYYTHFTSPIRRFPDLIVHKILFDYIEKKKITYNTKYLERVSEHSSVQERNAVNAERISIKIKQMEFLESRLGDEFNGVISGVNNYGLFIELSDSLSEGLVRIRDLEDDFYIYDEKNYSLIGKHKGKKYRIGDKVKVQLIRVDKHKREIDFLLS